MNDASAPGGSGAAPAAAVPQAATAGTMLRQAREAAGLHVAALAVALKVPVAKLEALEQDRYELLPDSVFVRALASTICRSLKIDPRPVLDRLPPTTAPRLLEDRDGINAPFRSPRDNTAPDWREQLTRPVALVVIALLLGALVLILLPTVGRDEGTAAVADSGADNKPAMAAPPATAASRADAPSTVTMMPPGTSPVPGMVQASLSASSAPTPGTAPPTAAAKPLAGAAVPAAAAPTAPEPATAAASASAPALANAVVVFRASGQTWVEVLDAKGVVAVRKLMQPGEAAGASGAMPLQVTIGKVDVTEVQVRGKRFDLRPFARDNVARFEVK